MCLNEMDKEALDKVNQVVNSQFPYLRGVEPEVSKMEDGDYLLIYKGQATTADGHLFPIFIRVLMDKAGIILKITSSH